MNSLLVSLLNDCYDVILCLIIISAFLVINKKKYSRIILHLFTVLCTLVFVETLCGSWERYLGEQVTYSPWRVFLSWVCYIAGPAILLAVCEMLLRDTSKKLRWTIAIPEMINLLVTSTAFFAPWCFSYEEPINHYVSGPLIIVPHSMPVIYLLILVVGAICTIKKNKWECLIILVSSVFILLNYYNELYGFVPNNLREMTIAVSMMAYFMYFTSIQHTAHVDELNSNFAATEEQITREMVDQSIETLAYTIDAKDKYTKGHSSRVAKYARMIARVLGKSEEECRQIYLTGLLHDIGKISISDDIINKAGKLTAEEFAQIKKHPENGAVILTKMKSLPFLLNGAKYHHERYDGKGYPAGLKGDDIPADARMISVADAYDAMTSRRSYRDTMDQGMVKQEIWKGMGTQFDPLFAKVMISLIDADLHYDMREKEGTVDEIVFDNDDEEIVWPKEPPKELIRENPNLQTTDFETLGAYILAEAHWSNPDRGFAITDAPSRIQFKGITWSEAKYIWNAPVALIFSSEDGTVMGPNYEELGVFMSAGYGWSAGASKYEYSGFTKNEGFTTWDRWLEAGKEGMLHTVSVRIENDMVVLKIRNEYLTMDAHLALPDHYQRPVYISFCGERCDVSDVCVL